MNIFLRQTVHQVKETYPILNKFVERFPSFFMKDNAEVSVHYRVAKAAAHLLVGIGSCVVAVQAVMIAPASFIPAFSVGMGCGAVAYVAQALFRRKINYDGSWSLLYLQGCTLLSKKWRWAEALTMGGAVLLTYQATAKLMQAAPAWACRQNAWGSGLWAGYLICDSTVWMYRRLKAATVAKRLLSSPQSD